jgi:hypothetical protein
VAEVPKVPVLSFAHPWRPRSGGRALAARHDERGETLMEVMMTVTIVGIAIVGLVGSLAALLRFSGVDRSVTNSETALVSFVEGLKALPYEACGGAQTPYSTSYQAALPSPPGFTLYAADAIPSGTDLKGAYLVRLDSVQYWNGATSPAAFQSTCPAGGDPGLQQLTARAWSVDFDGGTPVIATGAGQRVTFVKRAP